MMEHKLKTQLIGDLPKQRLTPQTPPFYYTSCDYFGPYLVKVGRNKTTKHYAVIFTCLNTRAIHLELAVDYSTMSFMQVLRRFFSIRGCPKFMLSDNGTQLVGAARDVTDQNIIKNTLKTLTLFDQLNSGTVYQPKQRDAIVNVRSKLAYLTYIVASQKHINFLITT